MEEEVGGESLKEEVEECLAGFEVQVERAIDELEMSEALFKEVVQF